MKPVQAQRAQGYSIVEFMVAAAIGLFILLGITTVFSNTVISRDNMERQAQQNDNGRYALDLLSMEIQNAGFLASFNPAALPTPATTPNPCAADRASVLAGLPEAIQGYDGTAFAPGCVTDVKANTDIIVIRRLSTCALGDSGCDAAQANALYFQASECNNEQELENIDYNAHFVLDTNLAAMVMRKKDCVMLAPVWKVKTHLYYIANNDRPGDGIPTLKRAEVTAAGTTIVPLVSGVEQMQVEYGIDAGVIAGAAPTGMVGAYTANPDLFNACQPAQCQQWWRNVVATKIHLIVRSNTPGLAYTDSKLYTMGMRADGTENTMGPMNDRYRRQLYHTTVRLFNVAGRNAS